ncbi:MAG: D-alanine--D-alanine ligase [Bacteroidales bacterium]|nr:D-alanine--D-alanine ligase [Bacteroidales bacterium]
MKKIIAIITGGDSSEIIISLRSAEQVKQCIDNEYFQPFIVYIKGDDWHVVLDDSRECPVNRHDFTFQLNELTIGFDFAFLAMHGPPGEDGKLQAYFDLIGIPYSTSGVLSLALTFNKYTTKMFLSRFGIKMAESILIRQGDQYDPEKIIETLGLPCFIKPNCGGSSFGVSKINRAESLEKAIREAMTEDSDVLVEAFIEGPELTCGLVKFADDELIFPVTEIVSKKEFFDYEAKYIEGMADEIVPAQIPDDLARDCQLLASKIYSLLDCRGIVRVDFINRNGELYFLELNGIPGMTKESIVPKMIRALGLTEEEVYRKIIEDLS